MSSPRLPDPPGTYDLAAPAELADPDVIVVPGGVAGTREAMRDAPLLSWLHSTAASARWVTSV